MSPAASLAPLLRELDHLDLVTAGPQLQQLSHDQFAFSPLLSDQLRDCCADVVVRARSAEEVIAVAAACRRCGARHLGDGRRAPARYHQRRAHC